MGNWRRLLARLGRNAEGFSREGRAGARGRAAAISGNVEPGEVALILLKNAARLLDQPMVPPDVNQHLRRAIRELEAYQGRRDNPS